MIFGIIWISATLALWGLIAWMAGASPPDDEFVPPVLIFGALFWPIALALALLMAPFLFIRALGERHAANTKEPSS
jgi:uncharacterized membrane protein YedE/YeeE